MVWEIKEKYHTGPVRTLEVGRNLSEAAKNGDIQSTRAILCQLSKLTETGSVASRCQIEHAGLRCRVTRIGTADSVLCLTTTHRPLGRSLWSVYNDAIHKRCSLFIKGAISRRTWTPFGTRPPRPPGSRPSTVWHERSAEAATLRRVS